MVNVSPSCCRGADASVEQAVRDATVAAQMSSTEMTDSRERRSSSSGHDDHSASSPRLYSVSLNLQQLWREEHIAPTDIVGLEAGHKGDLLGSGAFGEVRKVYWRKTPAAAKIAHPNMPEKSKRLFLRELEVLARVRHPNIVQFLGYIDTPFVIVMELVPGGDLKQYWRRRRVPLGQKTRICLDVLRALAYLHNRKPQSIIHRDIKPTNVLMTEGGVAKLTDFGLGRMISLSDPYEHGIREGRHARSSLGRAADVAEVDDAALNPALLPAPFMAAGGNGHDTTGFSRNATTHVGTQRYMAPEVRHRKYDERADIYSAGVTFYELFEQASFEPAGGFQWGVTPVKISTLIALMGSRRPVERPSALALIDLFLATGLSGTQPGSPSTLARLARFATGSGKRSAYPPGEKGQSP